MRSSSCTYLLKQWFSYTQNRLHVTDVDSNDDLHNSSLDVFASSLSTIFSIEPITVAVSDATRTFSRRDVTVCLPDPSACHWTLQADAIWRSSLYLSDHLPEAQGRVVLELGAGSGLPGLTCAREGHPTKVVLSDYPDPNIMQALQRNVDQNGLVDRVQVVGHAWGDEGSLKSLLRPPYQDGFDLIIGADILWMNEQHENLCRTLGRTLRRNRRSAVHLVAGFHTGRWPIANFLAQAKSHGFRLEYVREVSLSDDQRWRDWTPERMEDEDERRRWLIIIHLKWLGI